MPLPRLTFTEALCFLLPLAIGLTFPLQVLYGSSIAGALSLILLICLIGVSLLAKRTRKHCLSRNRNYAIWDWLVSLFMLLCAVNAALRLVTVDAMSLSGFLAEVYLIIQASLIYFYFTRISTKREVDSFFVGMVVMGIVSGTFFTFESFNKIALGQVSGYTILAHEYSQNSAGESPVDNSQVNFRTDVNYRSLGLLERHSTSALWMIFGFFAYSFLTTRYCTKRSAAAFTFFALLVAQNFTAIVVFLLVALTLQREVIRLRSLLTAGLYLLPLVLFLDFDMITAFSHAVSIIMQSQFSMIFTIQTEQSGTSYFSLVLSEFLRYGDELFRHPHQLVLGFGVGSSPSYNTSGDVGFIESMMRLGMPFWIFLTWNIITIFKRAALINMAKYKSKLNDYDARLILAATVILLSTWLMDLHYSAWIHKSIWPILFFAMALARRANSRLETK